MIELAIYFSILMVAMFFLWEISFYLIGLDDSNYENENKFPKLQKISNLLSKYKIVDLLYLFTIIYGNFKAFISVYEVAQAQANIALEGFMTIMILMVISNIFVLYVWIFFSFNFRIFNFNFNVPFKRKILS